MPSRAILNESYKCYSSTGCFSFLVFSTSPSPAMGCNWSYKNGLSIGVHSNYAEQDIKTVPKAEKGYISLCLKLFILKTFIQIDINIYINK